MGLSRVERLKKIRYTADRRCLTAPGRGTWGGSSGHRGAEGCKSAPGRAGGLLHSSTQSHRSHRSVPSRDCARSSVRSDGRPSAPRWRAASYGERRQKVQEAINSFKLISESKTFCNHKTIWMLHLWGPVYPFPYSTYSRSKNTRVCISVFHVRKKEVNTISSQGGGDMQRLVWQTSWSSSVSAVSQGPCRDEGCVSLRRRPISIKWRNKAQNCSSPGGHSSPGGISPCVVSMCDT